MKPNLVFALALLGMVFKSEGAAPGNFRTYADLNTVLASNPTLLGPHVVVESYWAGLGKGGLELVWTSADATDTNTFSHFKSQSTDWTSPNGRWIAVRNGNNYDVTTGGARGDWPTTADDATAINSMIAVLALNGVPANIIFPVGDYGIPSPIIVGKNNGASYSTVSGIHLIGDVKTSTGAPGQVLLHVTDGLAAGIIFQNCADCSVDKVNEVGMNSFFGEAKVNDNDFAGTYLNIENFKSSANTISTNRYAPHAGIAIDPFSATTPDQYPGLAAWYVGVGGGSGNIKIRNCTFTDFVVPWVITPADVAVDVIGHHFLAENCSTISSTYGIGFGTSFTDFRIKNHQWRRVFTAISTDDFGEQTGTIPHIEGHATYVTYLFQKALTNITTGVDIEYQNIQAKVVGGAGPEANGRLMIVASGYTGTGTNYVADDGSYKPVSSAGATINSADNFIPYRVNSTSFGNSVASNASTGITVRGFLNATNYFQTSPTAAGQYGFFHSGRSTLGGSSARVGLSVNSGTSFGNWIASYSDLGPSYGFAQDSIYVYPASSVVLNGDVIPASTANSHNLGTASSPWTNLFLAQKISWNGTTNTVYDLAGSGSPEGVVTASPGSTYRNYAGGSGVTLYNKISGTGNTGWEAIVSGAATPGDNWVASGTTNSLLYGRAFPNSIQATNTITVGSTPGSSGVILDGPNASVTFDASSVKGRMYLANGSLSFGATTQVLFVDNDTVNPFTSHGTSYFQISSDSGTASARTFILHSGLTFGHILYLHWTAGAGELLDDSTLSDTAGAVRLTSTWTPAVDDLLTLMFDGTDWVEVSRSSGVGGGGAANWHDDGATNANLYGTASMDSLVSTNALLGLNGVYAHPHSVEYFPPDVATGFIAFNNIDDGDSPANYSELSAQYIDSNPGLFSDMFFTNDLSVTNSPKASIDISTGDGDGGSGNNKLILHSGVGGELYLRLYNDLEDSSFGTFIIPRIADDGSSIPYQWGTPVRSNTGAPWGAFRNGGTNLMTIGVDGTVTPNALVIGSTNLATALAGKQPLDSDLTAVAGLSANGIVARTATGTMSARTITGTANEITVSNGDGVSGNPTLSLPTGISAAKIGGGNVSSTEFDFLDGVTSSIQTQITAASPPFTDTGTIVKGSSDATKLLRFEVDGFTTGTTRVATPPNADFTMARTDAAQTFIGTQSFGVINESALNTITLAGVAATPTDGLSLVGSDVATVGAQKYSPALHFTGSGWKTTATAAAQAVDWRIYSQPVQGAANPTANFLFDYSVNGGAFSTKFTMSSAGNLTASTFTVGNGSFGSYASDVIITGGGGIYLVWGSGGGGLYPLSGPYDLGNAGGGDSALWRSINATSTGGLRWGNGTTATDTELSRNVAGVVRFGTTTNNTAGWMQWQGQSRVSTQYDQTTSTLGNITGLTSTVAAGRTYKFVAHLDCTLDVTGGGKYAMGGTATATSISYRVRHVGASLAMLSSARQTALGSAVNSAASLTDDDVEIIGLITVNAGGTLTAQFAQQAAGGTSSVLVGSWLEIMDVQ